MLWASLSSSSYNLLQPIVLLPLPFYSAYMMYAFGRLYEGPGMTIDIGYPSQHFTVLL